MVLHMVNRSGYSEPAGRAWLGSPIRRRNTSDHNYFDRCASRSRVRRGSGGNGSRRVPGPLQLRTLDAYRHDLRNLFQWAADHSLPVLEVSRAHLEMYRSSMEARGLAASTIDRRLSTACGF